MIEKRILWLKICFIAAVTSRTYDPIKLWNLANVTYASENIQPMDMPSVFSPRMDFDQWKPLTGRGDPLRNDPTYDYEPPVLDRVHYWVDDAERRPERKSEVLMLGVSSRKPSVAPRLPPKRHNRPMSHMYEDYSYKVSDHYPMTILVPPPPPPPTGHKLPLYVFTDKPSTIDNIPTATPLTTTVPYQPDTYALQEANLIYQSSTTHHNWISDINVIKNNTNAVSSDYAGWGPTTPLYDEKPNNDTHNVIINDNKLESAHLPLSFYRPMLSESPPPITATRGPLFLPTVPPAMTTIVSTMPPTATVTMKTNDDTSSTINDNNYYRNEIDATSQNTIFPKDAHTTESTSPKVHKDRFSMLNAMLSMPLSSPERPEDNLYAHASEILHVYKEQEIHDSMKLEAMQTMQPPPQIIKLGNIDSPAKNNPFNVDAHQVNGLHESKTTLDPYLNMRYTTSTTSAPAETENDTPVTDTPQSSYLIIQGHSKVKTYSSKSNPFDKQTASSNEVTNPFETDEVKHLHPIKDKHVKKTESLRKSRAGSARDLKHLVQGGVGSIEIQDVDIGIKYDVSDGSEVPIEIYHKGIVENDENDYSNRNLKQTRPKRQLDLEDFLPFDGDQIEEYVYNFLKSRKNDTGITGFIASTITGEDGEGDDDEDDR